MTILNEDYRNNIWVVIAFIIIVVIYVFIISNNKVDDIKYEEEEVCGFFESLNKYGLDLHKIELIEICEFNNLNIRERYWQDHYDVLSKNGLNCVLTGSDDKVRVWSEETIEKITISMR